MMFWRKEPKTMPHRDVQAEAVTAIIKGAQVLPTRRLTSALYMALLDHRDMSVAELEDLGNRIGRLAWQRGRR